jgi:ribosomal protein S18 acetylase RimI-like enzyme
LGRSLLLAALHYLMQRGARRVHLGVWRDNAAAIRLYESVGFDRHGRRFYLAYDLGRL